MIFNFTYNESETKIETRGEEKFFTGHAMLWHDGTRKTEMHLRFAPDGKPINEGFEKGCVDTNQYIECWLNHNPARRMGSNDKDLETFHDSIGLGYNLRFNPNDEDHLYAEQKWPMIRGSSCGFTDKQVTIKEYSDRYVYLVKKASVSHVAPVYRPAYKFADAEFRSIDVIPKEFQADHNEYLEKVLRAWRTWKMLRR